MADTLWWHEPICAIQYNLQVQDTPLMDPESIARETEEMHANVLIINVGGIYAWYPSKVKYHHINEYLPKDYDLLARSIEECHKRNIRVIARFDFSKTDDYVSQERPEWFLRQEDGSRAATGMERPGNWSILYTTCINSGYRNEEFAIPVLEEVLDQYDIDGVFLNSPMYQYCTCEVCRRKYQSLYGKSMSLPPDRGLDEPTYAFRTAPEEMEPGFAGECYRENISRLRDTIHRKNPNAPLIVSFGVHPMEDCLAAADMVSVEAQNVLSRGWDNGIPAIWLPTINMKIGRTELDTRQTPLGIIHSSPGMDWRHTGVPQAEYLPWLRQIPAAGGNLWHSITGFKQTVTDKRILQTVTDVNAEIVKIRDDMDGAKDRSDVLLLWQDTTAKGRSDSVTAGWAQLLVNTQTQFDLYCRHQLNEQLLAKYPVVVVPDGFTLTKEQIAVLKRYAQNGGNLIIEGTTSEQLLPFADVIGIKDSVRTSEVLTACYWQFEPEGDCIRRGFEQTPIVAHRGLMAYTHALPGTKVLSTLIPPFAPLNSVGAPPERASMLVKHTDIPLCTVKDCGMGKAVMLPFQLSVLADTYRLADFYQLWSNVLDMLLGEKRGIKMDVTAGVIVNSFVKDDKLLVHMVNMIGQRPLVNNVSYTDFTVRIALPEGKTAEKVEGVLDDAVFTWHAENSDVEIKGEKLSVWEMFRITLAEKL